MNKKIASVPLSLTIFLALFSGISGTLLSPIFQGKLATEELKVNQVNDIFFNFQKSHLQMSLHAWRLTINSKASNSEMNKIYDEWLFSYQATSKWLILLKEYYPKLKELDDYNKSIIEFKNLETGENGYGLSDSKNKIKAEKINIAIEKKFLLLRRNVLNNLKVSIL